MLITFYRPWGTEFPDDIHPDEKQDWQHQMRLRADAAASRTNEIVDALVQDNLLGFAGSMTSVSPSSPWLLLFWSRGAPYAAPDYD